MAVAGERVPTYHDTESTYFLPNDDQEHQRLDGQDSAMLSLMKGKPFHAPSADRRRILDVGCGTGVTTARLARANPCAQVYGVDISSVPAIHQRPENVEFIVSDIYDLPTQDSRFRTSDLDLVFARMVVAGISDWPKLIHLYYDMLSSGGWVEIQEADWKFYDRDYRQLHPSWGWYKALPETTKRTGMQWSLANKIPQYLRDAGFVEIQQTWYPATFSKVSWDEHPESDEIGRFNVNTLRPQFGLMLSKLYERSGFREEQVAAFKEEIFKTLDMDCGSHARFYAFWARKP